MSTDFTQQQTMGELRAAERLSLSATVPPAEVPGVVIEKLLGQGAFGQVWKGRDLNTGRQVAIKFYLHRGGVNWSLLGREVKHLVNMSTGRYIVQVLNVGWEAEPPYYVMELLENGSLEDMVRNRGRLTVAEATSIFRQIAEGLNFAHGKGVLHCDLKPANVLLDHDWRHRLADFGQSRMSHEQSPSLGTLFYMAPEQADLAASADATWDVYALGAILHTMLVGVPPYRSPEVVETLDTAASLPERLERYRKAIYESAVPRTHYKLSRADKALCQIVDTCLAKQPENRFGNVQQVLEALSRRDTARARRPLYLAGIVGPMLLLAVMLFFSQYFISQAKRQSLESVQAWAQQSNQFAAKFAARTLEGEIAALFRTVEAESQNPSLRELVDQAVTAAPAELSVLSDGLEHPQAKTSLLEKPQLKQLEVYLDARMQQIVKVDSADGQSAIFDSLFVVDANATNLAIAYTDRQESRLFIPIGVNYSYRSYFTGLPEDLNKNSRTKTSPTRRTHFSATFTSSTTGRWKVAISAPIWKTDALESDDDLPIGVLVLTINLGEFDLLSESQSEKGEDRFAVLVDGRAAQKGTMLQHPLLRELATADKSAGQLPRIDNDALKHLRRGGMIDYVDPARKHADGRAYNGTWIAAMQDVHLPENEDPSANQATSVLWVLVQERASRVSDPIQQLGGRLQRDGLVGLGIIIVAICILWYFVIRMGQAQEKSPPVVADANQLHYAGLKTTAEAGR